MIKLIHDKDLRIYSIYLDTPGEKIPNLVARAKNFYVWARAKGYTTHQHLLRDSPVSVVKKKGFVYKPLTGYINDVSGDVL